MEANLKEHQITFSKGITNVPSDNICDDNCLSDCIGFRFEDGELKPVQKPYNIGNLAGLLLYIHKMGTISNYIAVDSEGLSYYTREDGKFLKGGNIISNGKCEVTSVGNVLVLKYEDDMKYALWKNNSYKVIDGLPEVTIKSITPSVVGERLPDDYSNEDIKKADKTFTTAINQKVNSEEDVKAAKDEVIGLIEGAYNSCLKEGYFTYPFWIRTAIKLYDGSYTMISNPVLVLPTVRRGAYVKGNLWKDSLGIAGANMASAIAIQLQAKGSFEGLEDIVSGISIFVSDQVKTWDESVDYHIELSKLIYDYILQSGDYKSMSLTVGNGYNNSYGYGVEETKTGKTYYFVPPSGLSDNEIIDKLINSSVFYKVADVQPNSPIFSSEQDLGGLMPRHTLENLTTQEQLHHDDYYAHAKIVPSFMFSYNARLQIANIKRYPYDGYNTFIEAQNKNEQTITAYVKIESKSGEIWVSQEMTFNKYLFGTWFYYPDPNATEVVFVRDGYWCSFPLKPHPRLNGAYFFNRLPDESEFSGWIQGTTTIPDTTRKAENLKNSLYTSDVNNPWIFNAEGDNTVGTGEIMGIVANTKAISQGQFGQHPLIVFTTEGIYALGVNTEGLYSTNYPMSREVCNNPASITPTDGAVFFTSEKGLMMMVGADITCVSQQMTGKNDVWGGWNGSIGGDDENIDFHDFLKTCKIAYDYRHSCLFLINDELRRKNNIQVLGYCYVYNIKAGTFTKVSHGASYENVINDYPDNLMQDHTNDVYSFLAIPDSNKDELDYSAQFISRPVKFSDAQSLKSLRQIKHVMDISGKVVLHIYVSNDLKHWGEVTSLRGSGWKYFRFGLQFTKLKATDSYSGMICVTQSRRFNKLR